jgi:TusA-related sulfurtransferase
MSCSYSKRVIAKIDHVKRKRENKMAEITPKTKTNDLLNAYPQLEAFLMQLNPKYKKLKNPILRRTVAKIATLTQVAKIGGYETLDLVNRLREEVGQPPLNETDIEESREEEAPSWIQREPKIIVDANKLLDDEKNPLAEVSRELKKLGGGEILLRESDFLPSPLIDTFKEQGYEVYARETNEKTFVTYIRK